MNELKKHIYHIEQIYKLINWYERTSVFIQELVASLCALFFVQHDKNFDVW